MIKNIINTWTKIFGEKRTNNIIMYCSLIVFIIVSLYGVINHIPFFDENNAWNIASYLKPSEIFEITRYEGHLFIWYFLIKPFAQYDIGYPIAMKLINWAFCLGAVILLWFKAPFNSIIKIFITFSLPIYVFYMHARCYSIGIFFLFLLCVFYKNRLKRPYLYAFLLILIANTSVMAAVLAFAFGVCWLYDLARGIRTGEITKKNLLITLGICLIGAIIVLAQLCKFSIPAYSSNTFDYAKHLYIFFVLLCKPQTILLLFCYLWLLASAWKFFEKDKKPFWILTISTYILFLIFCGVYRCAYWHFMFLFINIILALWIYLKENPITNNFQIRYLIIFCLMFISMISYPGRYNAEGFHNGITTYLKTHNEYQNHKIFLFPTDSSVIGIVPTFRKFGYEFFDCYGNSYKSLQLYKQQWSSGPDVDFDKIYELLHPREKAYVFVSISLPHIDKHKLFENKVFLYNYKTKGKKLKIKPMGHKFNVYIWEIEKK